MKGFIEITVLETKRKMLISVGEIKCVEELTKNETEITLALVPIKRGRVAITVYAIESYTEVVAKIEEATK